ncbi:DUF6912 family protein [Nocardia stercoris]|uniref:Uncharacterized protein n=1 Tax=Nocardia stercoris TaxID=2483361 RepID=A0A3M2LE00_9NOCA|nr:hypothetical protein [Nocardia stercoris]RMI35769.1 hypothetical protein EBN03_02105 [Nocardia stercoris]
MRVYVPATVPMLRGLVDHREIRAMNDTAFAVTPALREAYAAGDDDELSEVAMAEAARASLRLLADEREQALRSGDGDTPAEAPEPDPDAPAPPDTYQAPVYRRAVIAADVTGVTLRPDLDDAVVRLSAPITFRQLASVHVDLADAEPAVAKAVDVIDEADLGDPDAEFVLGDAEDHQLAWYAPQELAFLLDLL